MEDIPLDENYDSDSSLTATINKSLDLGRSLSDKCAELTKIELSDEDTEETRDRQETKGEEVAEEERCNRSIQVVVEFVISLYVKDFCNVNKQTI